jgi:hypothetical protein
MASPHCAESRDDSVRSVFAERGHLDARVVEAGAGFRIESAGLPEARSASTEALAVLVASGQTEGGRSGD